MIELAKQVVSPGRFVLHAPLSPAVWLAVLGFFVSILFYGKRPDWPGKLVNRFGWFYQILAKKYGFDDLYDRILGRGSYHFGHLLWRFGDIKVIDQTMVEGSAKSALYGGRKIALLQSGYLSHYTLWIILALIVGFAWYLGTLFF